MLSCWIGTALNAIATIVVKPKHSYAYSVIPNHEEFLFTGLVKHDLDAGTSASYAFGPDRVGALL